MMTTKTKRKLELTPLAVCMSMAHPRNPKEHNIVSLRQSFRRFGFVATPTVDVDGVMVAGHGRCEALLSMKEDGEEPPEGIDVVDGDWIVPLVRGVKFKSEREREAYVVADNQQVIAGGWDFEVLQDILGELNDESGDRGLEGLGFESIELESLLGRYNPGDPDGGSDPEGGSGGGGGGDRGRTTITATIECPNCHHKFER